MGQQPNIELEMSELPRPTAKPAPPRRWKRHRPGDIDSPAEWPWGGAFGTTGPDTGYALVLLRRRNFELAAGESREHVETALVAVISARSSRLGRAPVSEDVTVALMMFGLAPDGLAADVLEQLAAARRALLAEVGKHPQEVRLAMGSIPEGFAAGSERDVRALLSDGVTPF